MYLFITYLINSYVAMVIRRYIHTYICKDLCVCVCPCCICVRDPLHSPSGKRVATALLQSPTSSKARGPWPDSPTKWASARRWDPKATAGDCSCRVACPWWHGGTVLLSSGQVKIGWFTGSILVGCSLYESLWHVKREYDDWRRHSKYSLQAPGRNRITLARQKLLLAASQNLLRKRISAPKAETRLLATEFLAPSMFKLYGKWKASIWTENGRRQKQKKKQQKLIAATLPQLNCNFKFWKRSFRERHPFPRSLRCETTHSCETSFSEIDNHCNDLNCSGNHCCDNQCCCQSLLWL